MLGLTPFLLFDGNCTDAMHFYQSCFGGDLILTRLADTPMKAQMPPEQHHLRSSQERSCRVLRDRLDAPGTLQAIGQYNSDVCQR
jgi:uncharacterized glyoxalase superfamily protein PhnB